MGEHTDTGRPGEDFGGSGEEGGAGRGRPYLLLGGRISCVIGVLLAAGGALATLVGGTPITLGGALGVALCILGYFLGASRLATAAIVLCVASIFFALAASQGLIPGIESLDHAQPSAD
ncbi:MAG: hypothetical protein M3Q49_07120 [Actinomycetota bacterium]|nr:hypothetical protein [Actinomycetota bacterium]